MKSKITLPQQYEGMQKDIVQSVTLQSADEARACYQRAKAKLLNVNNWGEVAGIGSASFQLISDLGEAAHREAAYGDYIRIDIPGLKSKTGEGYDWVLIEKIEEAYDKMKDLEGIVIQVRPTHQPFDDIESTAHFFDSDSTSSFLIEREGCTVTASEHGRNEIVNTENKNFLDKIRNFFVALGAMIGLSDIQWKKLVKGFLE